MKITTTDCKVAIAKYFYEKETNDVFLLSPSLWKRITKTGSGDNIVREFENRENGKKIYVYSTESRITGFSEIIHELKILNLKVYLKEKLEDDFEFYDLPYEIFGEHHISNWPIVKLTEPEDPSNSYDEPLDMENFEWLSITDDEIVICCGGDWQEPLTLTLKLIDGKLTVTETSSGYIEGMDEDTFIKTITNEK